MSNDVIGARLPIRPRRRPDEWPETYLATLVRSHGVRRPWTYDVDLIRHMLPWEDQVSTAEHTKANARRPYLQGRPQYGPLPLPLWGSIVRAMPLRYCPLCMADDRYIRARWRISALHVCTVHGCALKSDLVEPALTVHFAQRGRLHLAECDTAQLLEGAACCMPNEFRAASMVWAPFEQMAAKSTDARTDEALGALAAWSLLMWRTLEVVSRIHHKKVIKAPTTGVLTGVGRLVDDLQLDLAPSRSGMLALFEGLRENAHALATQRLLMDLMCDEAKNQTVLSLLPLADLNGLLCAAKPGLAHRTEHGAMAFRQLRTTAMNQAEVKAELGAAGVGSDIIRRLLSNGQLRILQSNGDKGGKHQLIAREDVQRAKKYLLTLMHARDFVAEHELDWTTYVALRQAGLLSDAPTGLRGFIRRSDVALLTSRLELMSAPASSGPRLRWPLFSEQALYAAEQRSTFALLIEAATEGKFQVYRDLDRPGLSAFSMGADGIAWLAACRRSFFLYRRRGGVLMQPDLFDLPEPQVTP